MNMKKSIIRKRRTIIAVFATLCFSAGLSGCMGLGKQSAEPTQELQESQTQKALVFTVQYYLDENSSTPSDKTTEVEYGKKTKLFTVSDLGFSKEGQEFKGWIIYRETDDKWYVIDKKTNKGTWVQKTDGKLPEGYEYNLRKDGGTLEKAAKDGIVRLYGSWKTK